MSMSTMAFDENYARLAQFYTSPFSRNNIIKDILQENTVNYQIPANPNLRQIKSDLGGCTAIHITAKGNDYEAFTSLLPFADLTLKDDNGETVLHTAISMPVKDSKTLFELKSSFRNKFIKLALLMEKTLKTNTSNTCNNSGLSHFHIACMVNHTSAIEYYIKTGISVTKPINSNAPNLPGYTPLHCAARYSCLEAASILLDHGATGCCKDAKGLTPYHLLIERNMEIIDWISMGKRALCNTLKIELHENENFIESMLKKDNVDDKNMMNDIDLSYLHITCTLKSSSLAEKALEKNIDLEQAVSPDSLLWPGYTALHFAAHFNVNTVKLLIKKGANILAKDVNGVTPFDLCLQRFKAEDVEFLIDSQTNWSYIRFPDETFLIVLIQALKSECMLKSFLDLIMKDVNVAIPMDSPLWPGCTPLHLTVILAGRYKEIKDVLSQTCITAEQFEKIEKLLGSSSKLPEENYNCSKEEEQLYLERIKLMLEAGANVIAQDLHGLTPIHHAFQLQREDVVNLLLQNQFLKKLNPINNENLSHFHIACAAGNYSLVFKLLTDEYFDINHSTTRDYKYKKTYQQDVEPVDLFFTAGSTALHIAVIAREIGVVRLLVSRGADLNAKDATGMTPIHRLLTYDFHYQVVEIGRILLSKEDLEDRVTSFGLSHLHVASHVNNVRAVERLLKVGADIKATVKYDKLSATGNQVKDEAHEALSFLNSYSGYTPLDFAVNDNCAEAFNILLEYSGKIIEDPLKSLCCTKLETFLENLTEDETATILKKIPGKQRLHVACFCVDIDALRESLRDGADPNSQIDKTSRIWPGLTPLHLLVHKCKSHCILKLKLMMELLISHGADITLTNSDGVSPVHTLFDLSFFDFFSDEYDELLWNGHKDFSRNPTDARGVTHFHAACIGNQFEIVEKFLKEGIDVNHSIEPFSKMYGGYTPLHFAVQFKSNKTVDLLLKYGANVHAQDCKGNTPLHYAISWIDNSDYSKSKENIILSLISAGTKLNVANLAGEAPIEEIMNTKRAFYKNKIFENLSKYGCFVNLFDKSSGCGYIATAIRNERNIKKIMENPLFAMIMRVPDMNKSDEKNRTPIHNIVAIQKLKASCKIYIKAIHALIKLGYDIDQQDTNAETALHYAVKFQNSKAVVALLALGANINLTDSDVNTPFYLSWLLTCDIEKKKRPLFSTTVAHRILKEFRKHMYKLQLANLPVDECDIILEIQTTNRFPLCTKVIEQCQVELERLESRKFDSREVTLFSFLSETAGVASYPHMIVQDRQAVDDLFQNRNFKLHRDFPEFSGILQTQYKKARNRADIIESAQDSFDVLTEYILPDLCSYLILKYLKNEDLKNLIASEKEVMSPPLKRRKLN